MIEIKGIEQKDLIEIENMYTTSVKDNTEGFIQQLDHFPNIKDFIAKTQIEGGAFLGIFLDEKPIGLGGLVKKGPFEFELCKLHVKKEYKGQKYGEKLVKNLENQARILGGKTLLLHVTKTQTAAINLYKKLNFMKIDQKLYQTNIDGNTYTYDTIYMEKKLN